MRASVGIVLGVASLALLSACNKSQPGATSAPTATALHPTPTTVTELPQRKPGLWRQTMELAGTNKKLPTIQACTDAASEAKLNLLGQHKSKDLCQQQDFTRNLDGSIGFKVSCDTGPRVGTTVSTGLITGDFTSRYQVAMVSKTTGAPLPEMNTERKMTMTAIWIGPCAAGQRGGDVILADGHKFNLTDPKPSAGYR
jgi:hypothetical protein